MMRMVTTMTITTMMKKKMMMMTMMKKTTMKTMTTLLTMNLRTHHLVAYQKQLMVNAVNHQHSQSVRGATKRR